LEELRKK
jgi:hypothetical protein